MEFEGLGEEEEEGKEEELGHGEGDGVEEARARLMALMALRRCDMAASARDGSVVAMSSEAE